jgi:hypothetical protein
VNPQCIQEGKNDKKSIKAKKFHVLDVLFGAGGFAWSLKALPNRGLHIKI